MKQFTQRDRILAMVLPALIILMAYGLFVLRGKATEAKRVSDALANAKPPTAAEFALKRTEVMKLTQESQLMQAKLGALQKQWSYETAFCAAGTPRLDRVEKLTNLLKKYRLTPIEDGAADHTTRDAKVSPALETMVQKIAHTSNAQKPQLRRYRLIGRFADIHDALDELAKGPALAIPVGLTMKATPTPHAELREWTLLVWL